MEHAIAFIHLGPTIPAHTRIALAQARAFNQCPVYLVAEQSALRAFSATNDLAVQQVTCESLALSEAHQQFRSVSRLDKSFRDGFWTYTTERFFYLEALVRQGNLANVFHLENDYMLYADLAPLCDVFAGKFSGMAGTFDNDQRCIPGFLFVRGAEPLARLTTFISGVVARTDQPLNDMILLAAFAAHAGWDYFGTLPVVTGDYPRELRSAVGHTTSNPERYSNLLGEMGGVFDAAALGQYLGGVDPRNSGGQNTVGFINESCLFDPSVYSYGWKEDSAGRKVPYLRGPSGSSWPILGLHIHSKRLGDFASRR